MTHILADLFHHAALTAFVEQARKQQGWPDSEATKQRAYRLFESEKRKEDSMTDHQERRWSQR